MRVEYDDDSARCHYCGEKLTNKEYLKRHLQNKRCKEKVSIFYLLYGKTGREIGGKGEESEIEREERGERQTQTVQQTKQRDKYTDEESEREDKQAEKHRYNLTTINTEQSKRINQSNEKTQKAIEYTETNPFSLFQINRKREVANTERAPVSLQ